MEVATESIYNLIPKPKKAEEKKPIYRSKYNPKAPLTGSTFGLHGTTVTVGKGINDLKKKCVISSTFGVTPKKPDPSDFLRKGTRPSTIKQSLESQKYEVPKLKSKGIKKEAKPPVPSCNDKPIMGLKTCKNYIVSNATRAIIQKPKFVSQDEPLYIDKETYGKVPVYLQEVKKEIKREKNLIDRCVKEQQQSLDNNNIGGGEEEVTVLDEEERHYLINSLKTKWDYVNSKYQKICHRVSIDSLGDIKRKEKHESELQRLEDDIERLSRPGPLIIRK